MTDKGEDMKLDLFQVTARGGGFAIQNEDVVLRVVFGCPLTLPIARKLKLDYLYDESSVPGGARRFKAHFSSLYFDNAEVNMFQDENDRAGGRILKTAEVDSFKVRQDDDGLLLSFRISVPITSVEMTTYLKDQRREPAPKFSISGRQKQLSFDKADDEEQGGEE